MNYNVHNITFNQEKNCFTCSSDEGVRIYNAEPLVQQLKLGLNKIGSVSQVSMLYRTNLLSIVGGGIKAKFPPNVLKIWDDKTKQFVVQYTFAHKILTTCMTRDKLVVVLEKCAYIFAFPNQSKKLNQVITRSNPLGLCQVVSTSERKIMATLGHAIGTLQIIDLSAVGKAGSSCPININAHQNELACISLNNQGTIVATASEKGTLIRLFDTQTRQQIVELRRGTDPASLHCINFNKDSSYLCAASDKGTVHVFALKDKGLNRRSAFAKAGKVAPFKKYTDSQWSFCHFTVPAECQCKCVFGKNNSVIAVCIDGTYHKYVFTADGNCNRDEYDVYLEIDDDFDF